MNIAQTKAYIEKYHLSLSKSLGQNFLIDEEKLQEIVCFADLTSEDLVLEIGPGIGTLSLEIAEKCGQLMSVEIDQQMIPVLKEVFNGVRNVEIIHQDALELDLTGLCEDRMRQNPCLRRIKIVANLPYYITTPLITKFLLSLPQCERMVFTIQKEAADRIVSATRKKEYGILSVLSQFYSAPEIVQLLLPDCFFPQPTVLSCIIVMKRRTPFPAEGDSLRFFLKIVQASFNQRRKTLMNSLGGSGMVPGGKSVLEEILQSEGISLKSRAEELDYQQFLNITRKIVLLNKPVKVENV
jgi:16S rRNA (adenine1518-N6/adenine1519-N6)-dimethyltransferase